MAPLSLQPHSPATKPSGFPLFQMYTSRSKYRVLPGNAPAPQGKGWQEKFARCASQRVFHKAFVFYRHPGGRSSGKPVSEPYGNPAPESRAEPGGRAPAAAGERPGRRPRRAGVAGAVRPEPSLHKPRRTTRQAAFTGGRKPVEVLLKKRDETP